MSEKGDQEILPQNGKYHIEIVDSKTTRKFVEEHAGAKNEKNWVAMGGEFKWADGYPLFTFGASTCLVPVLVKEDDTTGMGHLPYVYIDRSQVDESVIDTNVEAKINNAKEKLVSDEPEKWTLYLFGGQPYDNTEQSIQNSIKNKNGFMQIFKDMGLKVYDYTTNDPNRVINGLILDSKSKKIQVEYEDLI